MAGLHRSTRTYQLLVKVVASLLLLVLSEEGGGYVAHLYTHIRLIASDTLAVASAGEASFYRWLVRNN